MKNPRFTETQSVAILTAFCPYCVAREGFGHKGVSTQPIKWVAKVKAG